MVAQAISSLSIRTYTGPYYHFRIVQYGTELKGLEPDCSNFNTTHPQSCRTRFLAFAIVPAISRLSLVHGWKIV